MEPGHVDREEHRAADPTGRPTESRNGARSRGPGRVLWPRLPWLMIACRNGARSRGPGRGIRTGTRLDQLLAAMEPGHVDREEGRGGGAGSAGIDEAAMEPGHVDREEQAQQGGWQVSAEGAAMEPGHVDREEMVTVMLGLPLWVCRNGARSRGPGRAACLGPSKRPWRAAMEPGHVDREEGWSSTRRPLRGPTSRNGARSRGPGRDPASNRGVPRATWPQWSPVTWTGKSSCAVHPHECREAAMEPGHVDREEACRRPWSRSRARFGRNGARSRGPGRALADPDARTTLADAAMEPGHVDREEDGCPTPGCTCPGKPQWSPVTWTGKRLEYVGHDHRGTDAAMEPGHVDREEPVRRRRSDAQDTQPQWSPVTWTGKSSAAPRSTTTAPTRRNGARSRGPGRDRSRCCSPAG